MTPATASVRLREWESRGPGPDSALADRSLSDPVARGLAERLAREGLLEVVELRAGLSVQAFSYVGTVRLGDLEITVEPKIDQAHLLRLLRYAYGCRKLRELPDASLRLDRLGFVDLLVAQLPAETAEQIGRGLHRAYVPTAEWLGSPRGRVAVIRIASRTARPASAPRPPPASFRVQRLGCPVCRQPPPPTHRGALLRGASHPDSGPGGGHRGQAKISSTTRPPTSVRRNSQPA